MKPSDLKDLVINSKRQLEENDSQTSSGEEGKSDDSLDIDGSRQNLGKIVEKRIERESFGVG